MKWSLTKKRNHFAPQKPLPSLGVCLLMDALGCASYLLPGIGEAFDVVWAPISAVVYFRLFGGVRGAMGGAFSFFEELMPGLDVIPTFTITWMMLQKKRKANPITIHPVR